MLIAVAGSTGRVGRHLVRVLGERGHGVVPISRGSGQDLLTGAGLAEALAGVDAVVDTSNAPSPDRESATHFFTTSVGHLHEAGLAAGVERLLVLSVIGIDALAGDYYSAKRAHEQAALAGPIPTRILRAAQFHEFVEQLLDWGTRGDVGTVPAMRTQLVSARSVAELIVDLVTARQWEPTSSPALEIAGPRAEDLVDAARLVARRRGHPTRVEVSTDPDDPDAEAIRAGALLPSTGAVLAGPSFESWLDSAQP